MTPYTLSHILGLFHVSDFNGKYLIVAAFFLGVLLRSALGFLFNAWARYQLKRSLRTR